MTAVIYTHAHIDHFGGVLGVVDRDTDVPILAPEHFLEHAVSENVYAGTAMLRRGYYYGGVTLPKSAKGTLGMGLGPNVSTGTVGLIAPTLDITSTGQEEVLDGVRIVFQSTPGTECPAEMNFYFPDHRALCLAENATHNLHNLLTLRGAQVRDPRIWSRYLAEASELFAHRSDVAFASHHWPTWGTDNIITYLAEQRDLYAYLHDQTLRLMNQGYVGAEIAEMMEMPPGLDAAWHTHGYYGSVSHNVKAIYQRYVGWYDGNPAHLWLHPPAAAAERYVQVIGGVDATVAKAIYVPREGRPALRRRAGEPCRLRRPRQRDSPPGALHGPDRAGLRVGVRDLAQLLPRRGTGAVPRDRAHRGQLGGHGARPHRHPALRLHRHPDQRSRGVEQDPAHQLDGHRHRCRRRRLGPRELPDGAEQRCPDPLPHRPELRGRPHVTLTKAQLIGLLLGGQTDGVDMSGDAAVLATLVGLIDSPDPDFAVVTP